MEHLMAAEHGDLWLGQLSFRTIYLGHGESLQHGQDGGERHTQKEKLIKLNPAGVGRSFVKTLIKHYYKLNREVGVKEKLVQKTVSYKLSSRDLTSF